MNRPITIHTDDIIQVKVPLPFPLRWVNSYVIRGGCGYTVIDPGLHTEASEQCWLAALSEIGLSFQDIDQIVLTHHHPDHYGLAGWFQQQSGAPVLLSEIGYEQAVRLWGPNQSLREDMKRLFVSHGMDIETTYKIAEHMDGFITQVSPQPEITLMREGQEVRLGDVAYHTLFTGGHAAGHVSFYDENKQIIFCGDHVLPQISPNISYFPGSDPDPLKSFLDSLEWLKDMQVAVAYPGHRDPFTYYSERVSELLVHHQDRLNKLLEQMVEPISAYELCRSMFGSKLTVHQLRFAMAETLAHTVYLSNQGLAEQIDHADRILYCAVNH